MQLLQNFTLAQLRAATKAQIITAITNRLQNMTKREIVMWLMENVDRIADELVRKVRADGQIESQIDIERDVETGLQTAKREVIHSYYPTGEVNEITIIQRDAASVEVSRKVIKHFLDGKQPEVIG